ncbi:MAG: toll/interleukin-1 receptor domain-containing protein, partial [Acidimicrobiia bacterium]
LTPTLEPSLLRSQIQQRLGHPPDLTRADLDNAKLSGADLSGAHLDGASIVGADLRRANLSDASFYRADLTNADLRNAGLSGAFLSSAALIGVQLSGASFIGANFSQTVLASDLSEVTGLEQADHGSPSYVSLDALTLSRGRIPPSFLRGCGLADWEIAGARMYDPALPREEVDAILYEISALRAGTAIQISPLFISYSHADAGFVDELEVWLNEKGVRFWRDVHLIKAGRVEKQLMRAITTNPTFLLVLSANSVNSDWVEWEAAKARELEKELGRDVLCPVALDGSWKTSKWPGPLRRQIEDYHILDFSQWQDAETFKQQFAKLMAGLRLFYTADPTT